MTPPQLPDHQITRLPDSPIDSPTPPIDNLPMATPFTLLRPTDRDLALRGIRVLVGGPESATRARTHSAEVEARIDGFLAYARSVGLNIHRQVLAFPTGTEG